VTEKKKLKKLIGKALFIPLWCVKKLKRKGWRVRVMKMVEAMPITDTRAMDFMAGC
jgi:hypothetical protein